MSDYFFSQKAFIHLIKQELELPCYVRERPFIYQVFNARQKHAEQFHNGNIQSIKNKFKLRHVFN